MTITNYEKLTRAENYWMSVARGFAVVLVVLAHLQQIFINPIWYPHHSSSDRAFFWYLYQNVSGYAVMLFFSLSGCLIFHSVARNIESNHYFLASSYIKSRLLRLYPPLILTLLLMLIIHAVLYLLSIETADDFTNGSEIYVARHSLLFDWQNFLAVFFFLNTLIDGLESPIMNGPLWSLAFEFWFYFGALVIVIISGMRLWLLATLGVVVFIIFYGYREFWALGFAVWYIAFFSAFLEYTGRWQLYNILMRMAGAATFTLWAWFTVHYNDPWYDYRNYYTFGMFFSTTLPFWLRLVRFRAVPKRKLLTKLHEVSSCSYTFYLSHFPVFLFIYAITNKFVSSGEQRALICVASFITVYFYSKFIANYIENGKLVMDTIYRFRQRFKRIFFVSIKKRGSL